MLITESFVLLNNPKTGSTFARTVIKEIYRKRLSNRSLLRKCLDRLKLTSRPFIKELMLPNIRITGVERPLNPHGIYIQIPEPYRNREIVTIIRNPYKRFISTFEYRDWVRKPLLHPEFIEKHFPSFPELSIDDFVYFCDMTMMYGQLGGRTINAKIGTQTVLFIHMFFKDPFSVLNNITDEYIDSDKIFQDIAQITFLNQENLNEELSDFLLRKGFTADEADYVRFRTKVNVTPKKSSDRCKLWTKKSLDYIQYNERMIFRYLKAIGIDYKKPFEE